MLYETFAAQGWKTFQFKLKNVEKLNLNTNKFSVDELRQIITLPPYLWEDKESISSAVFVLVLLRTDH